MDVISKITVKNNLELNFDIPFYVERKEENHDPVFIIIPENDMEDLFEIRLYIRQGLRIISEIQPQKHSVAMIEDMQKASTEKQKLFLRYLKLFAEKKAKVELYINQALCDPEKDDIWNIKWKKLRIRASGIITGDTSDETENSVILDWAIMSAGLMLSLLNIESQDTGNKGYSEGRIQQVTYNKYERNPANRALCLAANGYKCKICGFDFEKTYGEIGKHFIHVHHIEPVSSFGGEYYPDPITDLIPVCPNCHAMLHKTDPPMRPEELKDIINKNLQR